MPQTLPPDHDALSLEGRVAIVTGAGAGLGRAEALALARAGASVVLNDLPGAADEAAEEIRELGVEALVVAGDVGESATADAMMQAATEQLGRLDVVVNNAGITRDKMLFNMTDEEFDLVLKVHLRGHFLLSRNAASHWRGRFKETGEPVDGSVVNTASEAFLTGSPGQANYAAAKAGITALTLSTARGLSRVGVRANAICPRARTAMTAQVFVVYGGMVALLAAPVVEQRFDATGDTWDLGGLDKSLGDYFADRDPSVGFAADSVMNLS
jgi:NAD(P)-dependent dehydrogenase (short-subunit alcohol dehydrogenase family)